MKKYLVVYDYALNTIVEDAVHVCWSERDVCRGHTSIPTFVDLNAEQIKRDYISWVHDLGLAKIKNKENLRSYLNIFPHLSFWWLTLISEKSSVKCPNIYQIFKLRALELIYAQQKCFGIVYLGNDPVLGKILKKWTDALGVSFEWKCSGAAKENSIIKSQLKNFASSLLWFARIFWYRIRYLKKPKKQKTELADLTIVTYFPNIDIEKTRSGDFYSKYWGNLHDEFKSQNSKINWIWLYVDSSQCSYVDAVHLKDICDSKSSNESFFLVEEFCSFQQLVIVFFKYLKVVWKACQLKFLQNAFCFKNSNLNFFEVLKSDWNKSFYSHEAIQNIFYANAFDAMTKLLSSKKLVFVWENQPWELGLVSAYRSHQQGSVIAYQHAALSPLDLRSFVDPRAFTECGPEKFPIADTYALNGNAAWDLMLGNGYPEKKLHLVEALRYVHLEQSSTKSGFLANKNKILLVITGYSEADTKYHLSLVQQAYDQNVLSDYSVWIKPHPFLDIEPILKSMGASFFYQIKRESLPELWGKVARTFVANWSSTGIESMYVGLPTAVCAPKDAMNLSPLFGCKGITMVTQLKQLCDFLSKDFFEDQKKIEIFNISTKTNVWKKLLFDK